MFWVGFFFNQGGGNLHNYFSKKLGFKELMKNESLKLFFSFLYIKTSDQKMREKCIFLIFILTSQVTYLIFSKE